MLGATLLKCLRYLMLLFFLAISASVRGLEITANIVEQHLKVVASSINYPERIKTKELKSGLPNNISLLVSINWQNNKIFVNRINYQITYDLWDEIYRVQVSDDKQIKSTKSFESNLELLDFISHFELVSKEVVSALVAGQEYQISGQVLVNPVQAERIDKIRTWIANSQGHSLDPQMQKNTLFTVTSNPGSQRDGNAGPNASNIINQGAGLERVGSARPRFQKLFDKILEQYMDDGEVPALWHSPVVKKNIRLPDQGNEE